MADETSMLTQLLRALRTGEALENTEALRKWTNLVTLVTIILTAGVAAAHALGLPCGLTDAQIATAAPLIAVAIGAGRMFVSLISNTGPPLPGMKPAEPDDGSNSGAPQA